MDLRDLVATLLVHDALGARAWLTEARHSGFRWQEVPEPSGLQAIELALAAGIVETMAGRAGVAAPTWTSSVSASPHPFYLVRAAHTMPRLRRLCDEEGPEPLRRRGLLAPPNFLDAA